MDSPELTEQQLRREHSGWLDGNPFYLLIVLDDERHQEIDLGESGWATKHAEFMRAPGKWHLVQKMTQAVVAVIKVHEGEQPYYVAHHFGFAGVGDGSNTESIAYGLGKKRLDGHVDRLWLFSNGAITLGDDVDPLGIEMLHRGQL